MPASTLDSAHVETIGPRHWMERVLAEVERVAIDFSPNPIHDLRVALRRCRSMAAGYGGIDPDKSWKALEKGAKKLFRHFGELRDVQVIGEWVGRLGTEGDPVCSAMRTHLAQRELDLKRVAMESMQAFDRERWIRLIQRVQRRARLIPLSGAIFQLSALNAWEQARRLHKEALRNRSGPAFHRLRIGLKKFRYLVENFLPHRHRDWGADLKSLQDWLGEVHDLAVFRETAVGIGVFPDDECRDRWFRRIEEERSERIREYREKMMGKQSLWNVWRKGLPPRNRLQSLSLAAIQTWASFQGADQKQARDVRRLALQLYDGLHPKRSQALALRAGGRAVLHAAVMLYIAAEGRDHKKNDRHFDRPLRSLPALPGFDQDALRLAALVAHFARAKLKNIPGREITDLPEDQKRAAMEMAGILRLSGIMTRKSDPPIRNVIVERSENRVVILAENYSELSPLALKAARARYLLEYGCGSPVLIQSLPS